MHVSKNLLAWTWTNASRRTRRRSGRRPEIEALEGRTLLTAVAEGPEPTPLIPFVEPPPQTLSGSSDYDLSGNISYSGDYDKFQFAVPAGATITVAIPRHDGNISASLVTDENVQRTPPDKDTYLLGFLGDAQASFTATHNQTVTLKLANLGSWSSQLSYELTIAIAGGLSDVAVINSQSNNSAYVQFTYTVTGNPGPITFGIYRSADQIFGRSDTLVASQKVSTGPSSNVGRFTLPNPRSSPLATSPTQPYLLLVADPPAPGDAVGSIAETDETNNTAVISPWSFSGMAWARVDEPSKSVSDLAEPFRTNTQAFLNALTAAGAHISIDNTYRSHKRAYLLYWSWRIARENFDPRLVPVDPTVEISWAHSDSRGQYDPGASRRAATQFVRVTGIKDTPSLNTEHERHTAIDMRITWTGRLNIVDRNNRLVRITTGPRNGAANQQLQAVGRTYGVVKLRRDPPHWSIDGH